MTEILSLDAVEVHAEGEPGRILTSAAHLVRGDTMAERLQYCREHLDGLRRLVLQEPRGYPAMCAVILLPPVNPGSDFGIVVLEQGGFTPMSGSNTICAVTAAIETGIIDRPGPEVLVAVDTAVGTVHATARVQGGKVLDVTVANVPAFVVDLEVPLEVPELGTVPVDVVFGGQFFAQARVADLGLELDPAHGKDLARAGALIKLAATEQIDVVHPDNPGIRGVNLVMLHSGDPVRGAASRNTVVLTNGPVLPDMPQSWTGVLDRSPCGTGTSARMAALHARGLLGLHEPFHHRSIIGTEFVGELVGTATAGDRTAVLPTITGRGWVTGHSRWVLDDSDPFQAGYSVGDIWAPAAPASYPVRTEAKD
ncbi:proline racemase family protein [Kocuria sp. M1R5S2]|uniref:proline racemase family protein n=1 Tax=Kocuria rhizosphaerae TaxID=3376285 RepID=UPI0037990169